MVFIEVDMTVTLAYDPIWKAHEWAKKHCPSYTTNDVHKNTGEIEKPVQIDYYFGDEKEATWFLLKWQ